MAGIVFAMFKLAPANDRYKKTGIQLAIVLVLTIATELLNAGAVLTLIAGILSIVAEYQEYHGHVELIEEKDHQLSGKWTSLFMWSIVVGLILGFASTAAGVLAAVAGVDTETAAVGILSLELYCIGSILSLQASPGDMNQQNNGKEYPRRGLL